jgi:hypothetical protein
VVTGFRPEFLDFRRGIRVGNLEDNERITRILKLALGPLREPSSRAIRWRTGIGSYVTRSNRGEAAVVTRQLRLLKFFLAVEPEQCLLVAGGAGCAASRDEGLGCSSTGTGTGYARL